jgi:NAD(P)-dependent dehydrogenase (short-subunit alcohol dehydrogenase family)
VADEDAAYAALQVAVDAFGRLDVVVNNALLLVALVFCDMDCDVG